MTSSFKILPTPLEAEYWQQKKLAAEDSKVGKDGAKNALAKDAQSDPQTSSGDIVEISADAVLVEPPPKPAPSQPVTLSEKKYLHGQFSIFA
jgi:hypothetical protein